MIGVPFDNNDIPCLGSISQMMVDLVARREPVLVELADQYRTTKALAEWIRTLPQRDDEGFTWDIPKVEACAPPQRLRIPAGDPNCVERSALYIAVAELIDPEPLRQLGTIEFPGGRHVVPLENGWPVVLNPGEGVAAISEPAAEPAALGEGAEPTDLAEAEPEKPRRRRKRAAEPVDIHEAIEYTAQLAEQGAAATRNGPSRARLARNAIRSLIEDGKPPTNERTVDALGVFFANAEEVARQYGDRALQIVRSTALAIADLADDVLARKLRNLSFDGGSTTFRVPSWLSGLGSLVGKVGLNVGAVALAPKLAALGISGQMLTLVEQELNSEGLTLGPLANPGKSFSSAFGALRARHST